ncbi:hypothetical protein OESDEN_20155 [Oesophagostomum dentatum]|uniref:MKRN2 opposite strand protein-like C-terminal domain-containing protein n=1 Tax=Oesophagostomum dentatum TaxID=61180 RepID=A0A0B1SAG0_OESDE|nr:hypothetical protein OESDEN_20155 [Oesophagostomum dentatum]
MLYISFRAFFKILHYARENSNWKTELLPCPFVKQQAFDCALVVKPTRGSFLEYKAGDDLHIGISDSKSVVRSFWLNGISAEDSNWDGSLVIYRFISENGKFDQSLYRFISSCSQKFDGQLYDESNWNCFDFVVEFMRASNFPNIMKVTFVSHFVQKPLNNAIKYSALVHKAMENGFILL